MGVRKSTNIAMENKPMKHFAEIPQELLSSGYRKEMWRNTRKIIKELGKKFPVSSVHVLGSFTTKKRRPADVDFIVLLKIKETRRRSQWSVDLVLAPDNQYGEKMLKDAALWMKQKYGVKKSAMIKLV